MNTTRWVIGLMSVTCVCGMAAQSEAAEQGSSSAEHKPVPASSSAAPAASTPAATPPSVMKAGTAEGTLSVLNLSASPMTLEITRSNGKVMTLGVDPATLSVWRTGHTITLHQLAVGERVSVRYTTKGGRVIATSIEVAPPSPAAPRPSTSSH